MSKQIQIRPRPRPAPQDEREGTWPDWTGSHR